MDGCLLATLERIVENLEQAEDDLFSMAGKVWERYQIRGKSAGRKSSGQRQSIIQVSGRGTNLTR